MIIILEIVLNFAYTIDSIDVTCNEKRNQEIIDEKIMKSYIHKKIIQN